MRAVELVGAGRRLQVDESVGASAGGVRWWLMCRTLRAAIRSRSVPVAVARRRHRASGGGVPGLLARRTTTNWPIIPLSSCCRTWQWNMYGTSGSV